MHGGRRIEPAPIEDQRLHAPGRKRPLADGARGFLRRPTRPGRAQPREGDVRAKRPRLGLAADLAGRRLRRPGDGPEELGRGVPGRRRRRPCGSARATGRAPGPAGEARPREARMPPARGAPRNGTRRPRRSRRETAPSGASSPGASTRPSEAGPGDRGSDGWRSRSTPDRRAPRGKPSRLFSGEMPAQQLQRLDRGRPAHHGAVADEEALPGDLRARRGPPARSARCRRASPRSRRPAPRSR